jgi:hypothetical protein
MKTKKKKTKKLKSSSSKKQQSKLNNYDGVGFVENPYAVAAKIKNWKELKEFIGIHVPALSPAGVGYAAVKFMLDNYNEIKINYENPDAVLDLIKEINKRDRGARYVWQQFQLNTQNKGSLEIEPSDGALAKFMIETGYTAPKTEKTFQQHISMFKDHFGLKRKKKKVPIFNKDVEFKI